MIYLGITRPDLAYSIHILSQFMQNPLTDHLQAAFRVLRYLKRFPAQGIMYSANSDLTLSVFCDADWAACPISRRSITGYCFSLGGSIISWKTKRQTVVSRSSAESEYRALAFGSCEAVWLRNLLTDMFVPFSTPTHLHCDNQSAIHIMKNPVFHERTKHIEIDCHIARQHYLSQLVVPTSISSSLQPADILTKGLTSERISFLCSKLGVSNALYVPA